MSDMRRREFIALLGSAATAWPLTARAQQRAGIPLVGYLYAGTPEQGANLVAAFREGLSEMDYVEGQNVAIEYRWAHNDTRRLPELATDLVSRRVAVIATPAGEPAALAAKAATTTIPIVFTGGTDPVRAGLVASLNRPGGNIAGITGMTAELGPKRLGLFRELLPQAARFGVLINPESAPAQQFLTELQTGLLVSARKSKSSSPAPIATSTRSLQASRKGGLMPSWSVRRCYLSTVACSLLR